ncbi:MAG TPA: DUF4339 domain-containing protein, partial [Polyangiaceae bacterium]|nr:DUF4339 domain-containing protein [Polyangiaceae bacterium]
GEYSVDLGDHDQRTMSVAQLRAAFGQGSVTGDTFVWADGMADWQRIADVPDLFNQLSPTGASAAVAADPFTTPRASISTKERSSAADLFGGIESAGSEEDVTTSAPEPAPLAPAPQAAAATGARNESSVLFSLSALTGGAPPAGSAKAAPMATPSAPLAPAAPRRAATQQSRDDSGLIDLKALSTAVNAPGGSDAFGGGVSPLGLGPPALAPLGMPMGGSPLGGGLGGMNAVPAADDLDMRRSSGGKGPMIIGAAILIVGLAAVGVFAMRGGEETAASSSPAATPVVETPRAPAAAATAEPKKEEPIKAEEATAAPPPTGTAAPAAAPAAKAPTSTASRPSTTTKRPSTSTASTPKASEPAAAPAPAPKAAEPAPAPKKAKCNCKPTDLLCAMKCSSKK